MNDKFVDMPKCMADKYENADFIASDPVQFPRRYSGRDAEVSGFITSWLSFGNRKAIIGAAVEFQGMPERERLAFCSWCCCHGGCNLCADISKYNIKGLKIYGG